MQCLQDKKRNFLKDACSCDEETEMKLMKERHVSWSWRRSRATVGWQQMIWKKKSRACKQGKKKRHLCVTVQWLLLRLGYGAAFHLGCGACETADPSLARRINQKVRGASHSCAHGRKKEKRGGKWDEEQAQRPMDKKWVERRSGWFCFLLGSRMQTVKAVEQEISICQEMDHIIEKVLVHPRRQQQLMQEDDIV